MLSLDLGQDQSQKPIFRATRSVCSPTEPDGRTVSVLWQTPAVLNQSLILPEVGLDMFLNQHPCFSKVIRLPQLQKYRKGKREKDLKIKKQKVYETSSPADDSLYGIFRLKLFSEDFNSDESPHTLDKCHWPEICNITFLMQSYKVYSLLSQNTKITMVKNKKQTDKQTKTNSILK